MTDPADGGRPVTPVAIAAALLDGAVARMVDGEPLAPDVAADLRRARALVCGLDPYVAACTTPASPALQALAAGTAAEDWMARRRDDGPAFEAEMLSGHVEGELLKALVRALGARRALDVGMFTGYSSLAMAEAMGADGEVVALEVDAGVADMARRALDRAEAGARVRIEVGPALATLQRLAADGASFDMAFVDADKPGYESYLACLLDGLVRPGGLVVADNTLLQGEPYADPEATANGRAIAAFNRVVAEDPRVDQVLVPLRDGVTIMTVLGA